MLFRDRTSGVRRLTVLQPYVPSYRVPFFDELARLLAKSGWQLEVVHGRPEGAQSARSDAATGPWSVPVRTRSIRLRGYTLHVRPLRRRTLTSQVVIAELASTNLDTYALALLRPRRLMLWGHGRAYVTETSQLDARLERWLRNRAAHVFVYTDGGAKHLKEEGFPARRVTVVRNSTDTIALRAVADGLDDVEVARFRSAQGLTGCRVVTFVGSYDESKCLPLLFAAIGLAHDRMPDLRLTVVGAGPLQDLVDQAANSSPAIVSLPRADTHDLAMVGRIAECLVVPGRVGLVAVDALALGLPVVTTTFPHHAPEWEYLNDEVMVIARQNAPDLSDALIALLNDPERLRRARTAARASGSELTIQAMAAAFALAVVDHG